MGKRSDFERVERDCYDTPPEAVEPLLSFLAAGTVYGEPCAGAGELIRHLNKAGHICGWKSDIEPRGPFIYKMPVEMITPVTARELQMFISNPPWTRKLLHPIIEQLRRLGRPYWLLIDANWMFTAQAAPYLEYCATIVTIGRVKWIADSTMTGKDDSAWFLFKPECVSKTTFIGKQTRI